jgi:hypothetical protein
MNQPKPVTEEQREQVEERLAEGWPVSEIVKSGIITKRQGTASFKGRGWTLEQCGAFTQQLRRARARIG